MYKSALPCAKAWSNGRCRWTKNSSVSYMVIDGEARKTGLVKKGCVESCVLMSDRRRGRVDRSEKKDGIFVKVLIFIFGEVWASRYRSRDNPPLNVHTGIASTYANIRPQSPIKACIC